MSPAKIVATGIKMISQADIDVWLDIKLGDFYRKEISPGTFLIITENVKYAEDLCMKGKYFVGSCEIDFRQIFDEDIQHLGLTDADLEDINHHLRSENTYENNRFTQNCPKSVISMSDPTQNSHRTPKGSKSDGAFYRNNNRTNQSLYNCDESNDKKEPDGTMELNYLKPHEIMILYKTDYLSKLDIPELSGKHGSPYEAPILQGPMKLFKNAEFKIMKYLREIVHLSITNPIDESKELSQSVMQNIMTSLEEKFQDDAVAFYSQDDIITIYSINDSNLKIIKKYFEDNLHKELVPVADVQKFEFIKMHLSKEINKFMGSKDFLGIFPVETPVSQGFVVVSFGNEETFTNSKEELMDIIESIKSSKVVFNMTSEEIEEIMALTESDLGVRLSLVDDDEPPTCAIIKGIIVSLIPEKIEDQNVDAIVNSTSANFTLSSGHVSQAISMKAGPDLQKECSTKKPLTPGKVVETKGYNLACKSVFHCLAKEWNSKNPKDSQDIVLKIVSTCLEMANRNGFTNIAFPSISCGFLGMPALTSAECIFSAIESYDWTKKLSLRDIKLVVHDQRTSTFHAFQQVLCDKVNKPFSAWQKGMKMSIIGSSKNDIEEACRRLLSVSLK